MKNIILWAKTHIFIILGRSFYFPEIANGCTSIAFQNSSAKNSDGITVYEIAIKTINQWTQSPGVLIGTMETETQNSSIMNIQVRKLKRHRYFHQRLNVQETEYFYMQSNKLQYLHELG